MKLLDYVINKTNEYIENMPKSLRKRYGQFFTSKEFVYGRLICIAI